MLVRGIVTLSEAKGLFLVQPSALLVSDKQVFSG